MFIDSRKLPKDEVIHTEVCIVGAGPAGITLARELIGQNFRVCLLEGGGLEFDEETIPITKGKLPEILFHLWRPCGIVNSGGWLISGTSASIKKNVG